MRLEAEAREGEELEALSHQTAEERAARKAAKEAATATAAAAAAEGARLKREAEDEAKRREKSLFRGFMKVVLARPTL